MTTEWRKEQKVKQYYVFKGHPYEVKEALKGKLLTFFDKAQESEFELKFSASKSLIRLLGIDFNRVTYGEVLGNSKDPTALFLRDHREMLNFIRTVDVTQVPEEDKNWFKRTKNSLNRIFKEGIRFVEITYGKDHYGGIDVKNILSQEKGFIFKPENKSN